MTKKVTFIADDGTVFDDEYDCIRYEEKFRFNEFKDSILFFNEKGNELPVGSDYFDKCYYFICKTDESAAYLYQELMNDYDLPWPIKNYSHAGAWMWYNEKWIEIKEFLKTAKIAEKIYKLMEEG